ncbi:hypothetical protein [Campylobacter helveticus]|uniref:hypothetical protein n=1 Tax=Campylobacter helveticus TaxID=28898 RepID=UPI0022EB29B0|nr:hypothetical protein [Campylobacter helveticus]
MPDNIGPLLRMDKYEQFLQTRKEPQAIYLAINTNIKSFNNMCPSKEQHWLLGYWKEAELNKWYDPKFGVYLGKIVFDKKGNKLIPKYLPTSIENLEEEVKKIKNPLWLANKNLNYIKPELHGTTEGQSYYMADPNNLEYECKIEKNTQVLSQVQIISYVKEIHSKNVKMIQNYMDTINKDYGIKPYVLSDEIYDELGKVGILTKEQAERFKEGGYSIKGIPSLLLTALDYLAKQNKKDEDYLITFDDEYFYEHFVESLEGFTLAELFQGMLQNETKLLFNPAAYIDDTKVNYRDLSKEFNKRYEKEIFEIGFEKKYNAFMDYYDRYFEYDGFFHTRHFDGLLYDDLNLASYLKSPNVVYYEEKKWIERRKLIPSVLGKYYFEFAYQEGVYIELLRPYYPSIKDLPEGWDNKMLEKANYQ